MPHDPRHGLRESSKHFTAVALPGSSSFGKAHSEAFAEQRTSRTNQLLSRKYAIYWLICLVLCGCAAILHTTRLLDTVAKQHYLLAPPADSSRSAPDPMQVTKLHSSNSSRTSVAHSMASSDAHAANSTISNSSVISEADILAAQRTRWPEGYVAICAVVKDQWPDLRYWIEYHKWLGVSKFYIFDNNSTLPAMLMLWDYMQQGIVDYEYFLGHPRRRADFHDSNQYRAYQGCLLQHFKRHRWLAFIDADEFLVFPPDDSNSTHDAASSSSSSRQEQDTSSRQEQHTSMGEAGRKATDVPAVQQQQALQPHVNLGSSDHRGTAGTPAALTAVDSFSKSTPTDSHPDTRSSDSSADVPRHNLPLFLSAYEKHPAVGINWVLFGSSGHLVRPSEGPLAAYTACVPRAHWESTHVKVIAHTGGILGLGATPHQILPRPGHSTVDVDHTPFYGPKTPKAKWHKLVLHHYVVKSKAEFASKRARGSGAGNRKDWSYWDYVEKLATDTCTDGLAVSKAFMDSNPQLAVPAAARVVHDCHAKAVAAYQQLLEPPRRPGSQQQGHEQYAAAAAGWVNGSLDPFVAC